MKRHADGPKTQGGKSRKKQETLDKFIISIDKTEQEQNVKTSSTVPPCEVMPKISSPAMETDVAVTCEKTSTVESDQSFVEKPSTEDSVSATSNNSITLESLPSDADSDEALDCNRNPTTKEIIVISPDIETKENCKDTECSVVDVINTSTEDKVQEQESKSSSEKNEAVRQPLNDLIAIPVSLSYGDPTVAMADKLKELATPESESTLKYAPSNETAVTNAETVSTTEKSATEVTDLHVPKQEETERPGCEEVHPINAVSTSYNSGDDSLSCDCESSATRLTNADISHSQLQASALLPKPAAAVSADSYYPSDNIISDPLHLQKSDAPQTISEAENLDAIQLATELVQTYGGSNSIKIPPLEMLTNSAVEAADYSYQTYTEQQQSMSATPQGQYIPYQQQNSLGTSDRQAFQNVMNLPGQNKPRYEEFPVDKNLFQNQQYNMYGNSYVPPGNVGNMAYAPPQTGQPQERFRRNLSASFTSSLGHQSQQPTFTDLNLPSNGGTWNTAGNVNSHKDFGLDLRQVQPAVGYTRPATCNNSGFYRPPMDMCRDHRYVSDVKMATRPSSLEAQFSSPCPPRAANNGNFQNLPAFSDIDYSSIYPSRDFIEKSNAGAFITPTNSSQKRERHHTRRSRSVEKRSYCESPLKDIPQSFCDNTSVPSNGAGQKYFVVNPSDAKSMEPRVLIAKYIDFLILENEQRTEISKSMSIPVDIYVTEDMYFMDSLKNKVPFPSSKFEEWVKCFYPKLQISDMKFPGKHASLTPNRVLDAGQNDERPTQQVLEDIFYFFQRQVMNLA